MGEKTSLKESGFWEEKNILDNHIYRCYILTAIRNSLKGVRRQRKIRHKEWRAPTIRRRANPLWRKVEAQSHGTMLARNLGFINFIASGSGARTLAGLPKADRFGNSVFILGLNNEFKKEFKKEVRKWLHRRKLSQHWSTFWS